MKTVYLLPLSITLMIVSVPVKASELTLPRETIELAQCNNTIILPREIALKAKTIAESYNAVEIVENYQALEGVDGQQAAQMIQRITIPDNVNLSNIQALMIAFHNHRYLSGKALLDAVENEFGASNFSHELFSTCDYLGFKMGINIIARAIARNEKPDLSTLDYAIVLAVAKYYYLLHKKDLEGVEREILSFSSRDYLEYLPRSLVNSLGDLSFAWRRLRKISAGTFQGFSNLQDLNLPYNKLTRLDPTVFQGLRNLQQLNLDHNQLTHLDPALFNGLINLRRLYLGYNHLTQLHPALFKDLASLERLGLYNNQLTSLDPALAKDLTRLEMLGLYDNELIYLDSALFNGLTKLQELYLSSSQSRLLPKDLQNRNYKIIVHEPGQIDLSDMLVL